MAAIDKIYGTPSQHGELARWLESNNPALQIFLYPKPMTKGPVANFPLWADRWLLDNCPLKWVITRIRNQYNLPRIDKGKEE